METGKHCSICQLCPKSEQDEGSNACRDKIISKFHHGYWHNGTEWRIMESGRILTKSTILNTKKVRKARAKNEGTATFIVKRYTTEHEEVLLEWSEDVSGFQREGQMERFIDYMTTNPFSVILEYRRDGYLIGFSWLIIIDDSVIQQLFPWRKKRFSNLSLGAFENEKLVETWPDKVHFLGMDTEFKSKFGGWTYEGKALQAQNTQVLASKIETNVFRNG